MPPRTSFNAISNYKKNARTHDREEMKKKFFFILLLWVPFKI